MINPFKDETREIAKETNRVRNALLKQIMTIPVENWSPKYGGYNHKEYYTNLTADLNGQALTMEIVFPDKRDFFSFTRFKVNMGNTYGTELYSDKWDDMNVIKYFSRFRSYCSRVYRFQERILAMEERAILDMGKKQEKENEKARLLKAQSDITSQLDKLNSISNTDSSPVDTSSSGNKKKNIFMTLLKGLRGVK